MSLYIYIYTLQFEKGLNDLPAQKTKYENLSSHCFCVQTCKPATLLFHTFGPDGGGAIPVGGLSSSIDDST